MYTNQEIELTIPSFHAFNFHIRYCESIAKTPFQENCLHMHDEFEIYVNLSGDVSFLVDKNLYPLTRGDVIFTRPGEYHHCVYQSDIPHKHFCIYFDGDKNPQMMEFFLHHSKANYISPPETAKTKLIELCRTLLNVEQLSQSDQLFHFIQLIKLLENWANDGVPTYDQSLQDFKKILEYIDDHIIEDIKINDITSTFFTTTSTIERKFKKHIQLKPLEYIQQKKLLLAAEMLRKGDTVLNAGLNVGYSDNSYFIQLFKRQFGITPNQYKKRYQHTGQ